MTIPMTGSSVGGGPAKPEPEPPAHPFSWEAQEQQRVLDALLEDADEMPPMEEMEEAD